MTARNLTRLLFWLGAITAILLVYNLFAIYGFRENVFVQKGSIDSFWEGLIIPGFLLLLVFILASIGWIVWKMKEEGQSTALGLLLLLGVICCVLLLGEKAMIDEIARESAAGFHVRGEWIMLYVGLGLQLVYVGLMLPVLKSGLHVGENRAE